MLHCLSAMKKSIHILFSFVLAMIVLLAPATYAEDEFQPAYQNEGNYQIDDPDKYFVRHGERLYYTSGKDNEKGFRVNENNEESTDETIGILTFLLAPATIVYMNLIGWWE